MPYADEAVTPPLPPDPVEPVDPVDPPDPIWPPTLTYVSGRGEDPVKLQWSVPQQAVKYKVYRWFNEIEETTTPECITAYMGYSRYHVRAFTADGRVSMPSNYVWSY